MLILKSLTFSGIGRFVEEQTIEFAALGSLVQIDAINHNTGGSSGSGKSTIFKALEFLLGINDISNGVLQSRLTKDSMSVTGLFELDGAPLKIQRNKKLLIDLNGEVTTGSSKLTEEKLDEIIGMPRDLFRKILHKRQGEGGFFLDMGPSDVHKFLTSCLSLEKEQSKILTLDARLTVLTDKETSLKSALESNKMGLEATHSAILSLGPSPVLEIDPETAERLRNEYVAAMGKHGLIKIAHKLEMDELEKSRPQVATVPFDRTGIEQLENEIGTILVQIAKLEKVELDRQLAARSKISDLQIEASKLSNTELTRQSEARLKVSSTQAEIARLQNLEQLRQAEVQSRSTLNHLSRLKFMADSVEAGKQKVFAVNLAKELQKIRESLCPTCNQGWVNDAARAKEADILAKLQECKKWMIAGIAADKEILVLEEEKNRLNLESQTKDIPEADSLNVQMEQLKLDCSPKLVAEVDTINGHIARLKLESQPQAISEAIELKLKADFKNKELLTVRQEERDHQFNENAKTRLILDGFALKQTELKKFHDVIIRDVQDEEYRALSAYDTAKGRIVSFEQNKKRFHESYDKLKDQATKYQDQLNVKSSEQGLALEEIELAQEARKAIKSYLSCSFEDALDSIGDTATRLIRAIPNMSTSTIQFEGLKETKEGKVKEEVTCVISMDGEIGIPVKSLSGGERSSTDLAIDLSVIKFIEERTGKGIDLFVLDEPFTGLDTTNVFEALEMLKECSVDKRLLIVDHNPVAAQSIESRLTVVRDGLTSKIMQQ